MKIVTVRRIAQIFFFALFAWLCVVTNVGDRLWQLRGWPVNFFLQLDPLVALGTLLTTKTIYAGLLWALATVVLTIFLGRFFCGWVCPFGALHQFIGWLGRRRRKHAERVAMNQYRSGQVIKYYILIAMLAAASGGLLAEILRWPRERPAAGLVVLAASLIVALWFATRKMLSGWKQTAEWFAALIFIGTALGFLVRPEAIVASSLQTGLLDPIPLIHRSMNLVILTAFDGLATASRFYLAAWSIAAVFFAALLLNLWIPAVLLPVHLPARRAVWRAGALDAVAHRQAPGRMPRLRIVREQLRGRVRSVRQNPSARMPAVHELPARLPSGADNLRSEPLGGGRDSVAGNHAARIFDGGGFRTGGGASRAARRVDESKLESRRGSPARRFGGGGFSVERCIKCGQCMRVCPTNVIQPATLEAGLEGLWTPLLNFRVGTSGCQLNCIACGNVCPTSAIRPLSLDEKLGRDKFADRGPVRLGTAFVDQGRCLPWAMNKPCIVCQENCPVSPKAIYIREEFQLIRDGARTITAATADGLTLDGAALPSGTLGTGDYFVRLENAAGERHLITENSGQDVKLAGQWTAAPAAGDKISIEVRLQKPCVDPALCIGCGICEHECPVSGLRAIRVSAENESRNKRHSLMART